MASCSDCFDCFNTDTTVSCDFVKDKVCVGWSMPQGVNQDIYVTSGVNVFSSGFVAYDSGAAEFISVTFYNDGTQVGTSLIVYAGGSVSFTATNFTRIEVTVPDSEEGDISSGLVCLTPRYQVNCDAV
ncbi:hypothetical protein QRD89_10655 [Halobacillus sp. ACCC02827]|uniref:S-Ena type endospore appendage n=1 Tax=Halobacillus sp. ACCC02827 TaxID=3052090 RepID=UPI0025702B89|nr:S-Ena type endospore appendage [Halobacillus sp. ACCC02827]WJE14187.1 hypothetical protein QRD89_10655 [Halobacillus sp. ACCC02827]